VSYIPNIKVRNGLTSSVNFTEKFLQAIPNKGSIGFKLSSIKLKDLSQSVQYMNISKAHALLHRLAG
jgi:hypothetical protein